MTYLQGYQEHLEQLMADGGTDEAMAAAVDEFNACGKEDWTPSVAYKTWAGDNAPGTEMPYGGDAAGV